MLSINNFNDNWLFTRKNHPSYATERNNEAEFITLPHCFNALDGQNGEGMFRGACWYQKNLDVSKEDLEKRLFLEVGAASLVSEVYVNGILAADNRCGFSMYRVNLTEHLKAGNNLISIMVDNSYCDDVYPLMADFSFYGGIYRDVKLITAEALHFDLLDNGKDGIYVTQNKIDEHNFELEIKGKVINELSKPSDGEITIRLNDRDGNVIFHKTLKQIVAKEEAFQLKEIINNPILWQGVEAPYLYSLEVELSCEGKIYDRKNIDVGFRKIEITPDRGVFLNGKPIQLNGVSRHQDFAGAGNALTKEHMDLDMSLIKEIGANSIRLSHYQHNDYFYSLCDREGLLVWAEIPFISVPTTADNTNKNAKKQLERLIRQAYNHSSIYCWGIQNEITIAVENETIHTMVKELEAMAKRLDPSRFTAQANIYSVDNESPLNRITDLVGYNLYYGWYYKEMQDLGKRLDEFNKARPDVPVMVTEYGVDTNPKFHSYNPTIKDYTEEYQLLFHDNALKTFYERPFVLGGYVWSMFDFGSDSRNEGGEKGKNQKGLVTLDRKIKKDAFYLCKAYWSKDSFVKLAGRRFQNRHKAINDLVVLSNLSKVKLFVNNQFVEEIDQKEPMKRFHGVTLSIGQNVIQAEAFDSDGNVYKDEMILNYVEEPDKNYIFVKPEQKTHAANWFEKFDLTNVQAVDIKEGYYSSFDTIQKIYENPQAKEVFIKYFGTMAETPKLQAMIGLMSIESMSKLSSFNIPRELVHVINKELNRISKNERSENQ